MASHRYVIDTDVFIDFFNGQAGAVEIFELIKTGEIKAHFSILTEGELLAGCRNLEEQEKVNALLSQIERIGVDVSIIKKAAEYRKNYGKKHGTNLIDAIIAASCYCLDAKLITRNIRHFKPIKEISLYLP